MNNLPDTVGVLGALYKVQNAIVKSGVASYCEVLSNAKVPIVKVDMMHSGIAVDICCNNSSGEDTGKAIRALVKEFPPMRPLAIILKIFLVSAINIIVSITVMT